MKKSFKLSQLRVFKDTVTYLYIIQGLNINSHVSAKLCYLTLLAMAEKVFQAMKY